jgi:hypothetical protein
VLGIEPGPLPYWASAKTLNCIHSPRNGNFNKNGVPDSEHGKDEIFLDSASFFFG